MYVGGSSLVGPSCKNNTLKKIEPENTKCNVVHFCLIFESIELLRLCVEHVIRIEIMKMHSTSKFNSIVIFDTHFYNESKSRNWCFSFSCLILFPFLFLCNSFVYRFEDVRFNFPFPILELALLNSRTHTQYTCLNKISIFLFIAYDIFGLLKVRAQSLNWRQMHVWVNKLHIDFNLTTINFNIGCHLLHFTTFDVKNKGPVLNFSLSPYPLFY